MLRRLSDPLEEEIMEDWRDGLNSQAEVMGHLLSAQLFANATLIVGQDKVRMRVVKEIVQSLSLSLEQRLAGPGERRDEDGDGLPTFHFNDLEPEAMKQLLKFAYTHDWSWSGEVKDFSAVLSFLCLAEKLGVKQLARKIRNDVDAVMTTDTKNNQSAVLKVDTACQIFEEANSVEMENWKNCALQLILRSPSEVFGKVENYKMLTSENFMEILQNDQLEVESEIQLFHIVNSWAKAKCSQLGQVESAENRQSILKDLLPFIRFSQMSPQDFVTHVVPCHLLEMAEIVAWQTYFLSTTGGIPPIPPPGGPAKQQPRKYAKFVEPPPTISGSPVNFTHRMEKFWKSQKTEMLTLISEKSKSDQLFCLQLNIKLVSDYKILMSFLKLTSSNQMVKIELKVDTIKSSPVYEPPKSTISFNQVTSLDFESLGEETQLLCLVDIVKNSPNLRQLSIGHFAYYLSSPATSYGNMSQFCGMISSLKNLKFSCGFLGHPEMTKNLFAQLKGSGVTVQKLGFNWDKNPPHLAEILDLVQENLEEIHYLSHFSPTPTFQCCLDNLKILAICCDYKILLEILQKTPNVEKILFSIYPESSGEVKAPIFLPKLTSLSVFMRYKEDPQHLAKFFANCSNLSRLTCINFANAPMAKIYENFRQIKKFRYLQNGGGSMDNVVGMEEAALGTQHLNHGLQDRPPYIGNFMELTSLSFGYKDYQYWSMVANWNLDSKSFSYGIGHLQKMEKICFPPMALEDAKNILTFLTPPSGVTQLKLIKLQVWAGQNGGKDGTMKTTDVEKLALEQPHPFKIVVKQVYLDGQNRRCYF